LLKVHHHQETEIPYTGSELRSHFIYHHFNLKGSALVSWVGPCDVNLDKMVDHEDVKNKEAIFSKSMVHFIAEFFDVAGTSEGLLLMVARQRLLVTLIKEYLEAKSISKILRRGDDLYIHEKKLNVSIATVSGVSGLIHLGVNINSDGTPVPTISLVDLGINISDFQKGILAAFREEIDSMNWARCKVRPVS